MKKKKAKSLALKKDERRLTATGWLLLLNQEKKERSTKK